MDAPERVGLAFHPRFAGLLFGKYIERSRRAPTYTGFWAKKAACEPGGWVSLYASEYFALCVQIPDLCVRLQLYRWLDIEVLDVQGILFDELAAALDVFSHEGGEDLLAGGDVFELDLQQGAAIGVHGGLPE